MTKSTRLRILFAGVTVPVFHVQVGTAKFTLAGADPSHAASTSIPAIIFPCGSPL